MSMKKKKLKASKDKVYEKVSAEFNAKICLKGRQTTFYICVRIIYTKTFDI